MTGAPGEKGLISSVAYLKYNNINGHHLGRNGIFAGTRRRIFRRSGPHEPNHRYRQLLRERPGDGRETNAANVFAECPLYLQKRTSQLPSSLVRFVPIGDMRSAANCTLFDYRASGLEVD